MHVSCEIYENKVSLQLNKEQMSASELRKM